MPDAMFVRYAAPLAGVALASLLLQLGDRLGLRLFVSPEELGQYALGYSLTEIGVSLIFQVLHVRRFPLLLRQWSETRDSAYQALTRNVLLSTGVALALVPVMSAAGDSLVTAVGGDTFAGTPREFMVLIAAGLALNGAGQWAAVSLQFERKTGLWLRATGIGAVANLVAILVLGSWLGIVAGGLATLIAYGLMLSGIISRSRDPRLSRATFAGLVPPAVAGGVSIPVALVARVALGPVPGAVLALGVYLAVAVAAAGVMSRLQNRV
jgi:O-antigen/teichoic acid export membrane protein